MNTDTAIPDTDSECQHTLSNCPIELYEDLPVDSKLPQLAEEEYALLGFLGD